MPALPSRDCPLCPRLADFRSAQRHAYPQWFNAPVPPFGDAGGRLLIVGLAPGLKGANRTGRPFTGDFAGELLYGTLIKLGLARGQFRADPDDGLQLVETLVTNAVRCVPPQNKPLPGEIATCNGFLRAQIEALPALMAIVALGRIAHDAVLSVLAARKALHPFGHGAVHDLDGLRLFDSYHCSRYNTNTGVLTTPMFEAVFAAVRAHMDASKPNTSSASRSGLATG
jgi:uracil-DNA glycosylase family 4